MCAVVLPGLNERTGALKGPSRLLVRHQSKGTAAWLTLRWGFHSLNVHRSPPIQQIVLAEDVTPPLSQRCSRSPVAGTTHSFTNDAAPPSLRSTGSNDKLARCLRSVAGAQPLWCRSLKSGPKCTWTPFVDRPQTCYALMLTVPNAPAWCVQTADPQLRELCVAIFDAESRVTQVRSKAQASDLWCRPQADCPPHSTSARGCQH